MIARPASTGNNYDNSPSHFLSTFGIQAGTNYHLPSQLGALAEEQGSDLSQVTKLEAQRHVHTEDLGESSRYSS